jgi:hypothetical protein
VTSWRFSYHLIFGNMAPRGARAMKKTRLSEDGMARECLAIDVAGSIRSARVIKVLSKLVSVH